jgi:hypothetical protein
MTVNNFDLEIDDDILNQEVLETDIPASKRDFTEEASSMGWKPQEEWVGNPDDWVDAKEYVQRGELFDKIKSVTTHSKRLEKQMSQMKEDYKVLIDHHKRVAEISYEKAMKELKNQRREAMETGDYDSLDQIEEMIDDLKKEGPVVKEKDQNKEIELENQIAVEEWKEANSWYEVDIILTGAADAIARTIVSKNPSMKASEVLEKVTDTLKQEFPDKFVVKRRVTGNQVVDNTTDSGRIASKSSQSRTKATARNLNEQQRDIGRRFVEQGVFNSLDEYAQELQMTGVI